MISLSVSQSDCLSFKIYSYNLVLCFYRKKISSKIRFDYIASIFKLLIHSSVSWFILCGMEKLQIIVLSLNI